MKKSFIKFSVLSLAIITSISFVGCGSSKSGSDTKQAQGTPKYSLIFAHGVDENNTWHKAAVKFAETVKQKSNGAIEIKIYPNGQLGSETEIIQNIQSGTADFTITGESLQTWAPKAAMVAVPYLVKDSATLKKLANGDIGKEIEKQIVDKTGLLPITWFERGARELTSNRPIKTPDDLKNIIIRVPNAPLYVKTWAAAGAKPTPMALTEVFTALQQGTVQAQENPLALIKSSNFAEVQKYCNETEHVRSWIYVVMGNKKFNAMPADLQKVILDAAKEMQSYENQLFVETEKDLKKQLQDKGMTFVEVDKDAFAAKMEPGIQAALNDEQKALYTKIKNMK